MRLLHCCTTRVHREHSRVRVSYRGVTPTLPTHWLRRWMRGGVSFEQPLHTHGKSPQCFKCKTWMPTMKTFPTVDCATLRSFHNIIFDASSVETNFKMLSLALLAYLLHLGVLIELFAICFSYCRVQEAEWHRANRRVATASRCKASSSLPPNPNRVLL